jgi:Mg-chelatase subunit ChlD
MARKRGFSVFSLSFLDIMSCGFGATILIFLIMDHAAEVHSQEVNQELISEVNFLEREVEDGRIDLAELRNTIAMVDQTMVETKGRSKEIIEEIKRTREELATRDQSSLARVDHLNQLKTDIRQLEEENRRLRAEGERQQGEDVRRFVGDGDRQYLTGLKLGGKHVLILLDRSASMLDHSLVNIIRLRNMPDAVQKRAAKWQRAVATVDWLSTQLPRDSEYQIYTFSTSAEPTLKDSVGKWLRVSDREQLERAVRALDELAPAGGTSLANAFAVAAALSPRPDNIYLITDGLPTQGTQANTASKASGRDRIKFFNQALDRLPSGIPVNVILAPMEGDPMAASAFWQLAQATRGAFLAPSRDWP